MTIFLLFVCDQIMKETRKTVASHRELPVPHWKRGLGKALQKELNPGFKLSSSPKLLLTLDDLLPPLCFSFHTDRRRLTQRVHAEKGEKCQRGQESPETGTLEAWLSSLDFMWVMVIMVTVTINNKQALQLALCFQRHNLNICVCRILMWQKMDCSRECLDSVRLIRTLLLARSAKRRVWARVRVIKGTWRM